MNPRLLAQRLSQVTEGARLQGDIGTHDLVGQQGRDGDDGGRREAGPDADGSRGFSTGGEQLPRARESRSRVRLVPGKDLVDLRIAHPVMVTISGGNRFFLRTAGPWQPPAVHGHVHVRSLMMYRACMTTSEDCADPCNHGI